MTTLSNGQQEFVNNLLSSLENNQIPWQATWDRNIMRPYNEVSTKHYQGVNELNLWMTSLKHGFEDPRWMTFKQANEKGYRIRKGSVGTSVFNYALRNLETKQLVTMQEYQKMSNEEKENIKPFSKTYKVFNGAQIDGIPALDVKEKQIIFENEKAAVFVDDLLKNIELEVTQSNDRAFYRPSEDKVYLPQRNAFVDEQSFYATELHEIAHATSHPTRLNREISTDKTSATYAMEELKAELTSAFLTLDLGFHFDQFHEDNHTAYIQSWIKQIKDNPHVLFNNINDAQKIRKYMLEKGEYLKTYQQETPTMQNKEMNQIGVDASTQLLVAIESTEDIKFPIQKELEGMHYRIVTLTKNKRIDVLSQNDNIYFSDEESAEKFIKSQGNKFKQIDYDEMIDMVMNSIDVKFNEDIGAIQITIDQDEYLLEKDKVQPKSSIDRSAESYGSNVLEADTMVSKVPVQNSKETVVINLFAGPGAGKTTCAWEIASKLKKMGYVTEYVPEYAKELVWDNRRDLLDGTLEHQQALLMEQEHRVNRLMGKVDFIVTDAPSLLNLNFLKCDDQQVFKEYQKDIITEFNSHHNFNLFVNRGDVYETTGRVHTLEESISLDKSLKQLLDQNKIFYGTYDHASVDVAIKNLVSTYNRFNLDAISTDVIKEKEVTLDEMKNSIAITDYAKEELGFNVIKEPRGLYRLDEHDSCKIYPNNTFYRFSRSVGGSIIDFIKHFEECDTKEAIEKMEAYYKQYHPENRFDASTGKSSRDTNIKEMELPEKADTNKHIYAYLTKTRGISPSVVKDYIDRKVLYEDTNRNCVFTGKYNGTIQYAMLRGSNNKSHFKQDVSGSIKEVGVYVDNKSDTLIVNEAVIDQMSYQSLAQNPQNYNYLSVNGAANCTSAIKFHMVKREEASSLKKIIIGLDNDEAGETNTLKAIDFIKENYPDLETFVHLPEDANDFNEQLQRERNILSEMAPEQSSDLQESV